MSGGHGGCWAAQLSSGRCDQWRGRPLSQVRGGAARAAGINPFPPNEDEATRGLRTALDNAAIGIGDERDDCGRIVVTIDPSATIRLRNTLIIGPNTLLDATTAPITAAFPMCA